MLSTIPTTLRLHSPLAVVAIFFSFSASLSALPSATATATATDAAVSVDVSVQVGSPGGSSPSPPSPPSSSPSQPPSWALGTSELIGFFGPGQQRTDFVQCCERAGFTGAQAQQLCQHKADQLLPQPYAAIPQHLLESFHKCAIKSWDLRPCCRQQAPMSLPRCFALCDGQWGHPGASEWSVEVRSECLHQDTFQPPGPGAHASLRLREAWAHCGRWSEKNSNAGFSACCKERGLPEHTKCEHLRLALNPVRLWGMSEVDLYAYLLCAMNHKNMHPCCAERMQEFMSDVPAHCADLCWGARALAWTQNQRRQCLEGKYANAVALAWEYCGQLTETEDV